MADAPTNLAMRHRPLAGWLWKLCFALAILIAAFTAANAFLPSDRAMTRDMFGHDFLAFYSAGTLVNQGRAGELYDIDALSRLQQSLAVTAGLEMNAPLAPWWNPPHVALLFAPLAHLSFNAALILWTMCGLACLLVSGGLLAKLIRDVSAKPSHWMLAPTLLMVAPPTVQALGHGQNTPLSLLLLTVTVLAWRAREPLWAGLCCSLLCYKPQLAAAIFVALSLTLGWRVWIGMLVGGVPQLLLTFTELPGSMTSYLEQLPRNLAQIQFGQSYVWHRHATLNGFFRFMLQGNAAGATHLWITLLSVACAILIGVAVTYVWWQRRSEMSNEIMLDRFIVLVVLAMPLLMPFYFDYDLLLLMVAAVLVGREQLVSGDRSPVTRWLVRMAMLLFVWTMFNPPIAESFGFSFTVPLLCVIFALHARRCLQDVRAAPSISMQPPSEQRLAA